MLNAKILKVACILLIVLLVGCTINRHDQYQTNENVDYLKSPPLRALKSPLGISLPLRTFNYEIPDVLHNSAIGKNLDINPPIINYSIVQHK